MLMDELKEKIIATLKGKEMTLEELAGALGVKGRELRELRKGLAELVREGVILKKPEYEKRRHVFLLSSEERRYKEQEPA